MRDLTKLFEGRLIMLQIQHADLEAAISECSGRGQNDQSVGYLKKMRLQVEDMIAHIERHLEQTKTKAA